MASSDNAPNGPTKKQQDQGKAPISPAATSTIVPGKNPGERLASYFDSFFRTIVAISTLGASLTFTKIVQAPVDPWINYGIDSDTTQFYMAISWMLFLLALVITSAFASLLSLYRPQAIEAFATKDHKWKKRVMWAATLASLLLILLVFGSFIFLSLVVVAYTGPVGWLTLSFTIFFGILAISGIIWQSPMQWPQWILPKPKDDPTRIYSFHSKRVPTPPSYPSYGSDPFLRHMRLHGSLRHKRSFSDLHDVADDEKQLESYAEAVEKRDSRSGERYFENGHAMDPPPRREFRHDRRQRYSSGDHFMQYTKENRNSGASTLVPGANDDGRRWSNTIPPVRYSQRPYVATAFGMD